MFLDTLSFTCKCIVRVSAQFRISVCFLKQMSDSVYQILAKTLHGSHTLSKTSMLIKEIELAVANCLPTKRFYGINANNG